MSILRINVECSLLSHFKLALHDKSGSQRSIHVFGWKVLSLQVQQYPLKSCETNQEPGQAQDNIQNFLI